MKSIFIKLFILSIIIFIFSQQVAISQSLNDSLLIHYKFDGDSLDSSGNNFNPTLFKASYVTDKDGNENSALYFNGTDDLIILPDTSKLKPYFPLTISFWIKMDSLIPQSNVFFTNDFNTNAHSGAWLNLSSNQRLSLSYGNGLGFNPSNRRTKLSNSNLSVDVWYYITGVLWNNEDLRIYINGQEDIGFYNGVASTIIYDGTGGNIGRKDATNQSEPYFFKGYLDDFRYWNRGLSTLEIIQLYESETLGINNLDIDKSVSIYPNPVVDKVTLLVKNDITNYKVEIINTLGEKLISCENLKTIDVSALSTGLYFLSIFDIETRKKVTVKLLKN